LRMWFFNRQFSKILYSSSILRFLAVILKIITTKHENNSTNGVAVYDKLYEVI